MTDKTEIRNRIEDRIKEFADSGTVDVAITVLSSLGYNTFRRVNIPIDKDKLGNAEVKNASLFMQLSDAEMSGAVSPFGAGKFEKQNIESYLFIAVDLAKPEYNRSTLAKITRDINKLFAIPVFVVFRYGTHITLSIIYRRIHKRDVQKDVLEKVTLIKDINVHEPHRGHIDILCDLALPKLRTQYPVANFVELDNAWKKVLDTKELNKKFYKEISYWFHWAKTKARFPGGVDEVNLLRLLTRIIFIWFIKEKKLVHDNLFDEKIITSYLKSKDHYYNAILQNLFFGTLNCAIEDRNFRYEKTFQGKNSTCGVKTQYRYANSFKCGENEAKDLFASIPFLNGGLFDCLDTNVNETGKVEYIDGFSDTPRQRAVLPDELFFGEKRQVDLNEAFGTKNKKHDVRGLFLILKRYKFTVTENTPLEEDIALDPELLGNVFENLLAAYNPEARETARKQTGSFYTPREIVDYMVEQSLVSYPENDWQSLKILDPACGSGAFPMGVLNAMVNRFASDKSREDRYELKKQIIENCLFGVDIQPIAVQITKLRFFISLICEQEKDGTKENFGITALPNLETKFVAADTLLGIERPTQKDLSYTEEVRTLETELKEIRHKYFSVNTRRKKLELQKSDEEKRKELAAALSQSGWMEGVAEKIAEWNPYDHNIHADWFDPEWMFGVNEGFDVLIGNPPYRMLRADGRTLSKLYANQGYETYTGYGNIYCLFYERGWKLLKEGGHLCFITSNKWMRAGYGEKTRKLFAEKTNPLLLLDFANTKIFESATVDVNILLFAKEENQHQTAARIVQSVEDLEKTEPQPEGFAKVSNRPPDGCVDDSRRKIRGCNVAKSSDTSAEYRTLPPGGLQPTSSFSSASWIILSLIEQRIKAKIEAVGVPLKDWNISTYIGICTGCNEAFVIDGVKREAILRNCKTGEERVRTENLIRPLLRGRDIRRYHYQFADQWLIATLPVRGYDINEYPAVRDYLIGYGIEKLETTGQPGARKKAKNKWFQLQDAVAYGEKFSEDKIVWTDIATEPSFVNVKEEFFLLNTCSMIIGAPHYIVGILNSKLIKWYFPKIASDLGEGAARYIRSFVVQLPILQVSDAMNERLSQLLSRRLNGENVDEKIDALVFHLYGLTEEEMVTILLSQNVNEADRRRIQAFYNDYETKGKK